MSDHSLKVPQLYRSDDIIYHYTKFDTAIKHILKTKKLKLFSRSKSSDQLESSKIFNTIDKLSISNKDILTGEMNSVQKTGLKNEAKSMVRKCKQLSFSKNGNQNCKLNEWELENYFEYFGFAKPSMWDNYGAKSKGICLAFSRRKIEELIEQDKNFEKCDIRYKSFHDLNPAFIDLSQDKIIECVKQKLFDKHISYSSENEYRICSFSENEFDYIDISTSLVGIIASDLTFNSRNHSLKTLKNIISEFPKPVDIQVLLFKERELDIQEVESFELGKLEKKVRNYKFHKEVLNGA